MAVRIRMKRMGRKHRPFYRLCAVDGRKARDGKVIEYLGHYDPMVPETDARVSMNTERIDYWLSVGAQPSDKVGVLIKKYGSSGTHTEQRLAALERLKLSKPTAPAPVAVKPKAEATPAEAPVDEAASADETPADEVADVEGTSVPTPEPGDSAAAEG